MFGEFLNPRTKTMFKATPEEREQQKNEERTATGIVIGRNYAPTGTLKVYMYIVSIGPNLKLLAARHQSCTVVWSLYVRT
jgi:hypothetical protein